MEFLDDYIADSEGRAFERQVQRIHEKLKKCKWPKPSSSYCISGNTLRAFQGWYNRPRDLVDGWAERAFRRIDPTELTELIASKEGFDAWHASLHMALTRRWRYYEGSTPSLAHGLKLVDLFVKWLSQQDFGCPDLTEAFVNNAHCALDSQVLSKLNACYSYALPLGKPSMGDIINMNTYRLCQKLIERFAGQYGGTPLLFDYYAWQRGGAK